MSEGYKRLREQLEEDSPELYSALMRSWAIAEQEWLPAVSGNKGSFNSFPHLRNLEHHLDDILHQFREVYPGSRALEMIPIEKYMMLAAILFHDIGRTKQGKWHAHESRKLIQNDFAPLGIENKSIAKILGDICCFHDCSSEMEGELDLRDHDVTPYGVIHCGMIACLLKLVDNLDTAYTRVLPHYLHQDEGSSIEGLRRNTPGVRVDLRHQMIVTSVGLESRDLNPSQRFEEVAVPQSGPCPAEVVAYIGSHGKKTLRDKEGKHWHCWSDVKVEPNPEYAVVPKAPKDWRPVEQLAEFISMKDVNGQAVKDLAAELVDRLVIKKTKPDVLQHCAHLYEIPQQGGKGEIAEQWRTYILQLKEPLKKELIGLLKTVAIATSNEVLRELVFNKDTGSRAAKEDWLQPFWVAEKGASYVPLERFGACTPGGSNYWNRIVPYLIMLKTVFPAFPEQSGITNLSRVLFFVIAGSVRSSAELLHRELRDPLSIHSIPIQAWLLEFDEHLFTCAGRETFEPSLDKGFLREVVVAMWHLSAAMFGRGPCSFRTLAAALRVGDIDLVRTAVRRIAIVTRHIKDPSSDGGRGSPECCYAITFTRNDWRWRFHKEGNKCSSGSEGNGTGKELARDKHSQSWILGQIARLAEPTDDISKERIPRHA